MKELVELKITLTNSDISTVCENLGFDGNHPEVRVQVIEALQEGLQGHVDLRDWTLTDLINPEWQAEVKHRITLSVQKNPHYGDFRIHEYINGVWNNSVDDNWDYETAQKLCDSIADMLPKDGMVDSSEDNFLIDAYDCWLYNIDIGFEEQ